MGGGRSDSGTCSTIGTSFSSSYTIESYVSLGPEDISPLFSWGPSPLKKDSRSEVTEWHPRAHSGLLLVVLLFA